MARWLVLLMIWALQGCEPCSFVMGGHCQDRELNRDDDTDSERCFAQPGAPMPPLPRSRARG